MEGGQFDFEICLFFGLLNTSGGMVRESFLLLLLCSVFVSSNIFQSAFVSFRIWKKHRTLQSTNSWDLISIGSVPCSAPVFSTVTVNKYEKSCIYPMKK